MHKAAILIGDLGDPNAIQRRDGFEEAVSQYPEVIEVVARIPTEWNADTAFSGLTNALQANPDISFLFTSSDFLLPQIRQALRTADKWHEIGEEGHVIFTGFDGFPLAYELMADRYMDACGVQNLFYETELAIQAILDMQSGEKPDEAPARPGLRHHPGQPGGEEATRCGATSCGRRRTPEPLPPRAGAPMGAPAAPRAVRERRPGARRLALLRGRSGSVVPEIAAPRRAGRICSRT